MTEEEAIENIKTQLENIKKANECGLATKGEFNEDIEAIETVLNLLDKKDKIIDEMINWIDDRCYYSDDYGNSCEIIQDSCYNNDNCKECIKQYFKKKVEEQ